MHIFKKIGRLFSLRFLAKGFKNGIAEIADRPYFLIQRQFEMSDGGEIYIESLDDNYIGHFLVKSAVLQKDKIELELKRPNYLKIEISFKATEKEWFIPVCVANVRDSRHGTFLLIPTSIAAFSEVPSRRKLPTLVRQRRHCFQ